MAEFGYPKLLIELERDSLGGAVTDISADVTAINGYKIDAICEDITGAGLADDAWAYVGFTKKAPIELTGPYEDTALGLVAITRDQEGDVRSLEMTFDVGVNADKRTVDVIILSTERSPARGRFHEYKVTLLPTGTVA